MTFHILSDETIVKLSPDDRRELIFRLQRPIDELLPDPRRRGRLRRERLALMAGGAAVMIPWIAFLALTLPPDYTVHNWTVTWVGFDVALVIFMATTAVLGFLRRQLVILTGFATGILLVCDAWFDIMTAAPHDRWLSVAMALFAEFPVAVLMIAGTLRLIRLNATRLWLIGPGTSLWRLPAVVFADAPPETPGG